MSYTPEDTTVVILRVVHAELTKRHGDEIPPFYDFYLDKPFDELAGKTTGTVHHEHRCPVDLHDIYSTVEFDVRVYLYPGNSTKVREFKEDPVRWNNDEPSVPLYIIDLELDKAHYQNDNTRYLRCPDLLTGIPDITVVLGKNAVTAFANTQGELFPVDTIPTTGSNDLPTFQ